MIKKVLAIETSCDDTAVAIVRHPQNVEISLSKDQVKTHLPFGGVVPEMAGRKHTLVLLPLIKEALRLSQNRWEDIDGLAVTNRPGLLTSLFVGVMTAKTLALCKKKPLIGVNHLEAHLFAPFLNDEKHLAPSFWDKPFLALAVSGGHTHLYKVYKFTRYELLGKTLDDAAGEAFDKFAHILSLGFPGGVVVDKISQGGDPHKYSLPRPLIKEDHLNYSFSGLKTASHNLIQSLSEEEKKENLKNLCASFQQAVCESLMSKLEKAQEKLKITHIVLTGGVSANSLLRTMCKKWAQKKGLHLAIPPLRYCTDNAAMVGLVGLKRLQSEGGESLKKIKTLSRVKKEDFF